MRQTQSVVSRASKRVNYQDTGNVTCTSRYRNDYSKDTKNKRQRAESSAMHGTAPRSFLVEDNDDVMMAGLDTYKIQEENGLSFAVLYCMQLIVTAF